jgi:hypothetical protein
MEVIDNKTEGVQAEDVNKKEPRPTHEDYLRKFSTKLNDLLSEDGGYPLPAVIQVMDSALFEFRMALYMQQMELAEKARQSQKRIEIPHMKIPTNKK